VSDLRSFSGKLNCLPKLTIELTERCNNKCQHCYINRPAEDPEAIDREMSTDFLKDLIGQAADLGCLDLRISGGEPLIRDDFPELYVFSRNLGFQIIINTNARLISADLAALFKELPPGKPIGITTYGMRAVSYDKASGVQGSYEEFYQGIERLRKGNIDFGLQMAVLPDNMEDVKAYEEWVENNLKGKQTPVFVNNFYQRARWDDPAKNSFIQKLRYEPNEVIELISHDDNYENEMRNFCKRYTGVYSDRLFECGFGEAVNVDAYGFAQGCQLLRHPDMHYDLRAVTLAEVFFSHLPALLGKRATNRDFLNRCARCCLRGLCLQCPAHSWMEHGTLDTPVTYQCQIAHAIARKLGLLGAKENGWEIIDWHSRLK
jgi:radical SAM protein with 4Fe4S-binding SPASM domain